MPYKDRSKHRENEALRAKEYYHKNKQKCLETKKQYNINNPDRVKINTWKGTMGMKLREGEDWDSIYLFYITCENCEECDVILTDEKKITPTRRSLDHDHSTGFIRNVLCHTCNIKRR